MSRLDGKKGFSCITNCLPTKSRLGKAMTDKNKNKAPSLAPEYGASTLDVNDSYFNGDEGKYEQTKQWLQNLSTVANYEPTSILDDPETSRVEAEQSHRKSCSCCHDKCRKRPSSRCGRHFDDSDSVSRAKSKYGHSHACESKGKSCDDSCLSDIKPNFDESSFLSSKVCDSSALSSKCCSQHRRRRRRCASSTLRNAETSSVISGASSVSLATELVTLNMDECKHLGITIVGHSNPQGDCGIFVGSVKKDGAAALNGHIEPGDLILEVNGIDLERMTNEHALVTLKTQLAKGGNIQILIAKYWDMDPNDNSENHCYSEQLYEPCGSVHSVAAASVSSRHTASRQSYPQRQTDFQRPNTLQSIPEDGRMRQFFQASGMSVLELEKLQSLARGPTPLMPPPNMMPPPSMMPPPTMIPPAHSGKSYSSSSSSVHTSLPDSGFHDVHATGFGTLPMAHGMFSVPSRGSTIDRRLQAAAAQAHGALAPSDPSTSWHPFLGTDLINWIRGQANNMFDRRDAHVYAQNLLQSGYICNADFRQSMQFHETHYYIFGQNSSLGMKRLV